MKMSFAASVALALSLINPGSAVSAAEHTAEDPATNPLWQTHKTRNYLPEMTWPQVQDLLTRTDMVIIPIGALEQQAAKVPSEPIF